uniref:NFU1 iron-sulfur cluster scaffold homolog, mitochondrial n=1 Tax=Globodera rostochiensis TaxID=31243 RepID=A0A914GV10_GLORO
MFKFRSAADLLLCCFGSSSASIIARKFVLTPILLKCSSAQMQTNIRCISKSPNRFMFIQVQETPNPLSLKFLPGQKVLAEPGRTYEFTSALEAAKRSPLARQLLRIDGVRSVFFGEDFVSIQKQSIEEEWALLKPHIFAAIMDHLMSGKPVVQAETDAAEAAEPTDTTILPGDDEVVATIKELLESRIKPMVQEDGGDVLYAGFDAEHGVLRLRLKGACTGCPSSAVTLRQGIKNMMQFYVPEVKDVQEELDPEQELAAQALEDFEFKLKRPPGVRGDGGEEEEKSDDSTTKQ